MLLHLQNASSSSCSSWLGRGQVPDTQACAHRYRPSSDVVAFPNEQRERPETKCGSNGGLKPCKKMIVGETVKQKQCSQFAALRSSWNSTDLLELALTHACEQKYLDYAGPASIMQVWRFAKISATKRCEHYASTNPCRRSHLSSRSHSRH